MADPMKRLPMLPVERALKVISGRWKAVILYQLFDGPKRLSELQKRIPPITQKVLIQQLREMEEHGLVSREVFAQVPARVDYAATPLGLCGDAARSKPRPGDRDAVRLGAPARRRSWRARCPVGMPLSPGSAVRGGVTRDGQDRGGRVRRPPR